MRDDEVPQDESFYGGHARACYAVDRDGNYVIVRSSGWETERVVTQRVLEDLDRRLEAARRDVLEGRASPLAWHMAARQMTPALLARHARIARWRVRRHLRPAVFRRLGAATLRRYAWCLDVDVEALGRVPEPPQSGRGESGS